jgi:flagellar biosynthesis/type III secretory pathway protein FliH
MQDEDAIHAASRSYNYIAEKKIVSAEEVNYVVDATMFQAQTRDILNNLKRYVEEQRAVAYKQGFQLGYSEGIKNSIEDMIEAVESVRISLLGAEADLTAIVISAVEKIIGGLDSTDLARRAVVRALKDSADAVWVSIHVSPEDHPALAANMASIASEVQGTAIRSIEADALLKQGEMMIETPKGRVHIGLKQQITRLESGLGRASL